MARLTYRLNEYPRGASLWLSTLQWFIFTLASVITVPIVLGAAFGLTGTETAMFTDRTLFVCGLIGLLQVWLGHRLPIVEGPAGMWWGVWVVLIDMTRQTGGSSLTLLRELAFGLILAGALYLVLAAFSLVKYIQRLFTPVVSGTFMVLLSLQLSKSLVSGLLGIQEGGRQTVQLTVAVVSILLVALTVWLTVKGRGMVKSLAVLIGLATGWLVYAALGRIHVAPSGTHALLTFPHLLPFGPPRFHAGVALTCLFTAVILLTNLMTSIQVLGTAAGEPLESSHFRRGTLVSGVGTVASGLLGAVGCVPLATSASLVSLTGIASRLPFLMASGALVVLSLFPAVGQVFATLPEPVGYAVLFTVFGQLLGFGLQDFRKLALDQRDLFVVSLSVLSGVGVFFLPNQAWALFVPMVGYIFGNGVIVGIGMVLLLEHVVFSRAKKPVEPLSTTSH